MKTHVVALTLLLWWLCGCQCVVSGGVVHGGGGGVVGAMVVLVDG